MGNIKEISTDAAPASEAADPSSGFIVDEATDAVLRVHLDKFEGPMEVLLYLIKAQEIDIFQIPIARITDQYLKFLEMMEKENLEVAGDYLVLAATLVQIKSKMILPAEVDEDDEEIEEEDPRMELVEKLIAYRKYRDVASRLEALEAYRANWFTRNVKPKIEEVPDEEEYIEVSLFDLAQAFKGVARFIGDKATHAVETENFSVDEKIEHLQALLERQDSIGWAEIFLKCRSRLELICSFLAILELCKMGLVRAHQHALFGNIRLFKHARTDAA